LNAEKFVGSSGVDLYAGIWGMPAKSPIIATMTTLPQPPGTASKTKNVLFIFVRRKLPLPRDPAWAIPKEGTNLYWVAKLQGALERSYSSYDDSCLRVREILISVDFVALYFIAHERKLRKVPREFFKL
jgi:hypothetical protein